MKIHRGLMAVVAVAATMAAMPAQAEEGCHSRVEAHVGIHVDTNIPIVAIGTFLKAPSSAQITLCSGPGQGKAIGGGMLTLVYDENWVAPVFGPEEKRLYELLGIPYDENVPLTISFEPFAWKDDGVNRYIIGAIARPIGRTRSLIQKNVQDPDLLDELLNDWTLYIHVDGNDTPPDNDGDGFPDYRVTVNYPN